MDGNFPIQEVLLAEAISLALDLSETMDTVMRFRQDAGRKSLWSAHQRMSEAAHFRKAEAAAGRLTDFLNANMPAHWQMADWGLIPSRMGRDIRWASKGGRGMDGSTIRADQPHLVVQVASWVALIGWSQVRDEQPRLKELGLGREPITFSLHSHRCYHEVPGTGPIDATARLIASGEVGSYHNPRDSETTEELVAHSFQVVADQVDTISGWSVAPTLWARLRADRRVRGLRIKLPDIRPARPPWAMQTVADYDRKLGLALKLLYAMPKAPAGKLRMFHVVSHQHVQSYQAWCAHSAALAHVMSQIERELPVSDLGHLSIFEAKDDLAAPIRKIGDARQRPLRR